MTTTAKTFQTGQRVEFIYGWDLGHIGVLVEKGERGTISYMDKDTICVRMDRDYGDALAEWDNEIVFAECDDPGVTADTLNILKEER